MPYQIRINKKIIKVLEKMNEPDYSKVKEAIYALAEDPRPQGYIQLKGHLAYRIRAGNYRVIYEIIDEILTVQIMDLGHRKDIYK